MIDADSEPSDDFEQLLHAAARGDLAAQDRLCRHYESKVRIVARVRLGPELRPHFDSMDIVQSVHRSLLIGIRDQKFDISSPEKLIALASTMVRRKVARKWRMQRQKLRQAMAASPADDLAHTLSALSSPASDPAEIAEYTDQIEHLCANLNPIERRMLQLRLDGYTSPEVAHDLGLHPVAVRVRWTRLRQRLQAAGIIADWL